MLPRFLLAFGVLAGISAVVRAVHGAQIRAVERTPWDLAALEHGAMACMFAVASGAASWLSPALGRGVLVAGLGWVAADADLFVHTGLRLQFSSLWVVGKARAMAPHMPWRWHLGGGLLFVLAVWAGTGAASVRQPAAVLPWLMLTVLGLALFTVAAVQRRHLPLTVGYGWNLRLVVWLGHTASRARAPAHDGDPSTVSPGLIPQGELSEPLDPRYPLLRRSGGFTGDKHFHIVLPPDDRPHVVWVFLESFRAADVGALGNHPGGTSLTPCFDALCSEGVLWRDFYANGTITSLAMLSAFYGVPPPLQRREHQQSFVMPPLIGMPQVMAERGYLPAYFCDGPLDWEDKRMFSLHHGFRLFYGAPSIKQAYPQAPETVWHFRDEFLMRFHVDWLAAQTARGMPTFSSLLTVSNHFPWQPPPEAPHPPAGFDPDSVLYRYMRTTMYTDWCLGLHMDLLRERGLYDKCIFLLLGDHAQQVNNSNDVSWSGRYTSEGVRVPCLLVAPGRLQGASVIDEVASQVDLLPTFLDMFNARTTHHAVGTSLMRRCTTREALSVHPWAPGMVATRFGPWRHVYNLEANQAALYNVHEDPQETRDVSQAHTALAQARNAQVRAQRHMFNTLYGEERLAPPQDTTYLRDRFSQCALDWFPRTLEDCRKRLQSLRANLRTEKSKKVSKEISIWMLALDTAGLPDDERLEFAQLLMARLYIDIAGEMTDAQDARLAALESKAITPETMAPWDKVMVDGVRPMAHEKPGLFFRTAR